MEVILQGHRCVRKSTTDSKIIPKPSDITYEIHVKDCDLTTLETRRLGGDQREVFIRLNGYENIDRYTFYRLKKVEELEDLKLH